MWWPRSWQDRWLVTVRVLYLMFIRVASPLTIPLALRAGLPPYPALVRACQGPPGRRCF